MVNEDAQNQRLTRLETNQDKMLEQVQGISRAVERIAAHMEREQDDHDAVVSLQAEMRVVKWVGGVGGGLIVLAVGYLLNLALG